MTPLSYVEAKKFEIGGTSRQCITKGIVPFLPRVPTYYFHYMTKQLLTIQLILM